MFTTTAQDIFSIPIAALLASAASENDTMFLAYRVTIPTVPEPGSALLAACGARGLLGSCRHRKS